MHESNYWYQNCSKIETYNFLLLLKGKCSAQSIKKKTDMEKKLIDKLQV